MITRTIKRGLNWRVSGRDLTTAEVAIRAAAAIAIGLPAVMLIAPGSPLQRGALDALSAVAQRPLFVVVFALLVLVYPAIQAWEVLARGFHVPTAKWWLGWAFLTVCGVAVLFVASAGDDDNGGAPLIIIAGVIWSAIARMRYDSRR